MRKVAFLQGATPIGQNRIPKMVYPTEILTEAGLENIRTYIQSGNIVSEATLSDNNVYALVHDMIQTKVNADLSTTLKTQARFTAALTGGPFGESHDDSRVYLAFTNDQFNQEILSRLLETDFGAEILKVGSECLYLYLPRETKKRRLNISYLEKQLHIIATVRKRHSILQLGQM